MDFESLPASHRVQPLLAARLGPRGAEGRVAETHAYWPAAHFGLDRVGLYVNAREETQRRVLDRCGRALLEEAYFIEKSGVAFAAEMILLAESIEERMLYALFAAEEARHFDDVRSFLAAPPGSAAGNPFLALLAETIECADRTALQFLIQVVLEGWGLSHYRSLRDGCVDEPLRASLDAILHDEAGHHGSGRVLFGEAAPGEATARRIEEVLSAMLRMVQMGPQSVLSALEAELGHLGRAQKLLILNQLEAPAHSQARLDQLHKLARWDSVAHVTRSLEEKGLFRCLSNEDCL
jgi:rubrerythrin